MGIAIGTFIELPGYNFQNFFQGEINLLGRRQLQLCWLRLQRQQCRPTRRQHRRPVDLCTVNELSASTLAKLAADQRHIVTLSKLSGSTPRPWCLAPISCVTSSWSPALSTTATVWALRLSSPLDAISGDVPRRRLTEKLVGALPSTGQIQLI